MVERMDPDIGAPAECSSDEAGRTSRIRRPTRPSPTFKWLCLSVITITIPGDVGHGSAFLSLLIVSSIGSRSRVFGNTQRFGRKGILQMVSANGNGQHSHQQPSGVTGKNKPD
jgi:hypothetical protein